MPASSAVPKLRLVCVSDTHNYRPGEGYTLPAGDVLIHAGDLTNQGSLPELQKAVSWIDDAAFGHKVVIAGNHDLGLDQRQRQLGHPEEAPRANPAITDGCTELLRSKTDVVYLEHASVDVSFRSPASTLRIFGSPWTPAQEKKQDWAFQYPSQDRQADSLWDSIPSDADVVITHGPPAGHLDLSTHWAQGGCPRLLSALRRVKPLLHICGHCHEGRGAEVVRWAAGPSDEDAVVWEWRDPGASGKKQSLLDLTGLHGGHGLRPGLETAIVNASIMARSWNGKACKAFNKPIVIDIALPRSDERVHTLDNEAEAVD